MLEEKIRDLQIDHVFYVYLRALCMSSDISEICQESLQKKINRCTRNNARKRHEACEMC